MKASRRLIRLACRLSAPLSAVLIVAALVALLALFASFVTLAGCAGQEEADTYRPQPREPAESYRSDRGYSSGGGGCFPAGTPVLTENGLKPIESVTPGTRVWAMDPVSGRLALQPALQATSQAYGGELVRIRSADALIEVTGNHPFWVAGGRDLEARPAAADVPPQDRGLSAQGRWVQARDLQPGDRLLVLNGQTRRVDGIEARPGRTTVYNLSAAHQHTYVVHAAGFLVHNKGEAEKSVAASKEAPVSRQAAPAAEPSELKDEAAKLAAGTVAASGDFAATAVPRAVEKRARIYSGFCRLTVNEVEESKRELETLAARSGGYVETIAGHTVTLRIPAERFREVFAAVLDLGDVVDKSIETYDVSDVLRDQETRLQLSERARQRLYQLLERTSDVEERLAILREIRRLTEEIEQIRLTLELLRNQVALSRITVELIPRQAEPQYRYDTIPFPWIAVLNPLYVSLSRLSGRIDLTLGEDFAVFEEQKSFRAESPEGTRVRIGSRRNRPEADELFWQKALAHHLGPQYRQSELLEAGPFRAVLFTSKDSKPFAYLVGITVDGKWLHVLEAFFPDAEAREKRLDGMLAAMKEIGIR